MESGTKAVKESTSDTDMSEPRITFRNYAPYDTALELNVVPPHKDVAEDEESSAKRLKGSSGRAVVKKPEAADIIKQELEKQKESDPSVVVQKKIDHDLKLLVAGKLHKLQKRTRRAIVDIMREKLSNIPQGS